TGGKLKMKRMNWTLVILAVCMFGAASCKKQETGGPPQEYYGVKVDWPKLNTVFSNATPEVQASVEILKRDYRYAQYNEALPELEKLSNDPNLTAPQKKLLTDLTEQTKQVIAKAPPPPAR